MKIEKILKELDKEENYILVTLDSKGAVIEAKMQKDIKKLMAICHCPSQQIGYITLVRKIL